MLSICGRFSYYMGLVGVTMERIDETVVERFLGSELAGDGCFKDGPRAMGHLLRYLREHGIIAPAAPPTAHPFASTLEEFDNYLRVVRGLAATTRQSYLSSARVFIDWLRVRYGERALSQLAGTDVLEFITEKLGRWQSRSSRAHICSNLRGFLRYLQVSGTVDTNLDRVVPRVSTPRLASLPRRLDWEQVRAVIDGVDTSHPDGMRDKAVLLLLAMLGLRSCEVRMLELRDIAWRSGEIRLPRTKTRRERVLPLLDEVGAALADYILHGRPAVEIPQVLLRHGPRPGAMASANTVIWIVRRHLHRAGIRVPGAGAHMLRHSLATRMVNAGVPIKSVADVLGHTSIDTTAIYTKVDEKCLVAVAMPFPGGAG
jgi:site-specific recombinase XerD